MTPLKEEENDTFTRRGEKTTRSGSLLRLIPEQLLLNKVMKIRKAGMQCVLRAGQNRGRHPSREVHDLRAHYP